LVLFSLHCVVPDGAACYSQLLLKAQAIFWAI